MSIETEIITGLKEYIKSNRDEVEETEKKSICPHCKIEKEFFGSTCHTCWLKKFKKRYN